MVHAQNAEDVHMESQAWPCTHLVTVADIATKALEVGHLRWRRRLQLRWPKATWAWDAVFSLLDRFPPHSHGLDT
jgi:hypothetical protein